MSITLNNNYTRKIALVVGLLALVALMLVVPAANAYDSLSISIPALGVNSHITEFTLNGVSWNINPWEGGIGHLQGTGWFGNGSNIALGGHSWLPDNTPGIFANLHTLQSGEEIVINANGEELRYTVSGIRTVSLNDLSVLYPTNHEQLTLITCDAASFDPDSQYYQRRIIVTAVRSN